MENFIARIRRMVFLLVAGFAVIIYIGLGIIYFQQAPKQRDLLTQIAKINPVLVKPLSSAEKLQADYDAVNRALAPIAVREALDIIVSIAKNSGIDVAPDSGKFNIPPPVSPTKRKLGEGTYQVLILKDIKAQGSYASVRAFIADLDSGKTLKTMVLTGVKISQTEVKAKGGTDNETAATLDMDIYMKPGK